MKFDLKINKADLQELPAKIADFLAQKSRLILALITFLFLAYVGYLWYLYVINPQWSDSRKQDYMNTRNNAVLFDQKRFDAVIAEIAKRKAEYNSGVGDVSDIFILK